MCAAYDQIYETVHNSILKIDEIFLISMSSIGHLVVESLSKYVVKLLKQTLLTSILIQPYFVSSLNYYKNPYLI